MTDLFNLDGRHALVTGASSGLGRHFAVTLARAGARVSLAARRADALADTVTAVEAAGGQAQAVVMDVTERASVAAAIAAAEERFGRLDILVNNAGIAAPATALDLTEADWDAVIDTNLKGVFLTAQEAGRRMAATGGGSIVNVASILGLRVTGGVSAYAASKAGVVQLTKSLALEWARHGIRVNAIAPGYVETEMNAEFFSSDAGKAMIRRVPQRRLGRARELDGALLLLASDAGSYMTGSIVAVDGGHLVSGL
ncbi:SDR family NAD(P)-dependent oxidoreductase [Methylobacterium dankookense]|uniref:Gluconate 5-dehydrogenase n=1 Tax=Methylobacterium dankookense TaxID=560405 RepID=A0ABQ4RQV2_9HYPH|nr:SDR family NAD(P)-dependent oxidoreductase [Methylobacterium dankookense]GJD59059.1 Gluconate 5-dehydrogenase [Methylobacterium dankookense]